MLVATLFPKEYKPPFTVVGTKKHTQFTDKPKVPRELCPYSSRSRAAGEWNREQTLKAIRQSNAPVSIYQIMEFTCRAQTGQQKTLNALIEEGLIHRSQPNKNKSLIVLYWIAK